MAWPTWQQAAMATVAMLAVAALGRWRERAWSGGAVGSSGLAGPAAPAGAPSPIGGVDRLGLRAWRVVVAAALELALISFLYGLWRLARQLPLSHEQGAYQRGRWIYQAQRWLHLPSELSMERLAMHHRWLGQFTVDYYATVHVPALIGFLIWLYVRHRDAYPRWRNGLAITTGFCLFIRFLRVAPPRLLPEYGFIDLPARMGRDIYGPVGTGASDQFAAMPSIHIAWAAVVAFGVWAAARRPDGTPSRWRWIGPAHLVATFWAVMATANHWWLDGLVAMALLGIALAIDDAVRRRLAPCRLAPGGVAPDPDHADPEPRAEVPLPWGGGARGS
jgi:hypothetical protein